MESKDLTFGEVKEMEKLKKEINELRDRYAALLESNTKQAMRIREKELEINRLEGLCFAYSMIVKSLLGDEAYNKIRMHKHD